VIKKTATVDDTIQEAVKDYEIGFVLFKRSGAAESFGFRFGQRLGFGNRVTRNRKK
jgi:hypothetical protein